METIIQNSAFQITLALISVIEFIVAVISCIKISKVRKSQIEYRDIVELDYILQNIRDNTDLLKEVKDKAASTLSCELITRLEKAIALNYECVGAVNKANQILFESERASHENEVIYYKNGYFNTSFYNNIILNAKSRIILYIKRNVRPFTLDNLSALIALAENENVKIEIFAFSPKMHDYVFREMMRSIPNCPQDIKELRSSQTIGRNFYLSQKTYMKKSNNITYYEYRDFPLSQYIVVDDKFYWGIVNYDKTKMDNVFESRPYLEMSVTNPFAKYILSLKDTTISECTSYGDKY